MVVCEGWWGWLGCQGNLLQSFQIKLPSNRDKPVKAGHKRTQTCKLICMSAELIYIFVLNKSFH